MPDPPEPGTAEWRRGEARRLLGFAERAALREGGFGRLDACGGLDRTRPRELWINARMTHVFGLAALEGRDGAADYAGHGVRALRTVFRDAVHGGWYSAVNPDGTPHTAMKTHYDHCFVLLAASTARAAGAPGAGELLEEAQEIITARFWREADGLGVESYARDWTDCEDYRGANSNMHAVEAFMACGDVTGQPRWRERALAIAQRLVDGFARAFGWRLPEHFTAGWSPLLDYNDERRADPFRPYGTTVGHWLEWSRLLIGLYEGHQEPPAWLPAAARTLFEESVAVGWAADDRPGFAYTLDWDDTVVIAQRVHWVHAEAVLAADALNRSTGHERAGTLAREWWAFVDEHFRDTVRGSWHHELDPALRVATTIWAGKPDIYHAYQAVLLPDLPLGLAPAAALAARERRPAGGDAARADRREA